MNQLRRGVFVLVLVVGRVDHRLKEFHLLDDFRKKSGANALAGSDMTCQLAAAAVQESFESETEI